MMKQAFAFLAMTLSPACVYGVDGVVLINQATVNAAGGFPYRITQPGSYKLSGNLTLPTVNTTGIDILSDNVTLDLNGFTIAGPLPCFACLPGSGDGVHTSVRNHITVRNGSIVGADWMRAGAGSGGSAASRIAAA